MHKRFGLGLGALGVVLAACAGPTPTPAAAPPAAARPVVSAERAAPAGADAGLASEPAPAPVAEAPTQSEKQPEPEVEEKPSHPPVDILTSPDTAFLINYAGSAPLEVARKTCGGKRDQGGTDDDAIAKCMTDARAAFKADVLRFKKDGSHWSCIVYKRDNSRLDEVYSARVDLSEDAPNRVKLKFTGAEKGMRVLLRSKRDTIIQVPNDYSFVVTDPELGKLVYEAKVGLIAN